MTRFINPLETRRAILATLMPLVERAWLEVPEVETSRAAPDHRDPAATQHAPQTSQTAQPEGGQCCAPRRSIGYAHHRLGVSRRRAHVRDDHSAAADLGRS